ncbi:MAG: NAD(P)/FAD-dependent oxidoreductase [Pseudomonadota bacterium]
MSDRVDAVIIGAGPAGCTAAALLAEQGMSVRMVERDAFPRFKIGESLLPGGNAILKRIGVWDKMDDAGFIRKYGAEFVTGDGASRVHNVFADGLVPGLDYAYQVERSRFDKLLLDNAVEKGVELRQPCRVASVTEAGSDWQVTLESDKLKETVKATWLLDASGRAAFLGKRLKLMQDSIGYPKRFAVYNHFQGIPRRSGREAGNIVITRLSDGWFWAIPLDENKTSVGVVSTRKRDEWADPDFTPETFFNNQISRTPFLADLMAQAQPCDDYHVTADYTYSFSDYAGPRHMLLGDAAGFIDPIFSSGVYLAMRSAAMAADSVLAAQKADRPLTQTEQNAYTLGLKKNVRVMRDLIEVFYDSESYSVFMAPSSRFKLFESVNSIVAGNSSPEFSINWRFRLFLLICKINRYLPLVPRQRLA